MLQIRIASLRDLKAYQNKFDCLNSSITTLAIDIFNQSYFKEEVQVNIVIKSDLLPTSYQKNPYAWRDHNKDKIKYPHIAFKKTDGFITITASLYPVAYNFQKKLEIKLREESIATFRMEEIPPSHQANPYSILTRLRKKNLNASVTEYTETQITYKLK